jgi:hypothetical protein
MEDKKGGKNLGLQKTCRIKHQQSYKKNTLVYLAVGSPQVTLADKARAASLQYRNIQFINTHQNDYLCKHGI